MATVHLRIGDLVWWDNKFNFLQFNFEVEHIFDHVEDKLSWLQSNVLLKIEHMAQFMCRQAKNYNTERA